MVEIASINSDKKSIISQLSYRSVNYGAEELQPDEPLPSPPDRKEHDQPLDKGAQGKTQSMIGAIEEESKEMSDLNELFQQKMQDKGAKILEQKTRDIDK